MTTSIIGWIGRAVKEGGTRPAKGRAQDPPLLAIDQDLQDLGQDQRSELIILLDYFLHGRIIGLIEFSDLGLKEPLGECYSWEISGVCVTVSVEVKLKLQLDFL